MQDQGVLAAENLSLRLAVPDDMEMLFRWRNDPWIVALSSSRREVTREEHARWFREALDRDRHLLFIVRADSREIGTVRIDRQPDTKGVLSIYLLKAETGKAYGVKAIRLACEQAFDSWPDLGCVLAVVREGNRPSIGAFSRAGFTPDIPREAAQGHIGMQLQRPNRAGTR